MITTASGGGLYFLLNPCLSSVYAFVTIYMAFLHLYHLLTDTDVDHRESEVM